MAPRGGLDVGGGVGGKSMPLFGIETWLSHL